MGWRQVTGPPTRWIEIVTTGNGQWVWRVWNADKTAKLAEGAEAYTRYGTAARGARRFVASIDEQLLGEVIFGQG